MNHVYAHISSASTSTHFAYWSSLITRHAYRFVCSTMRSTSAGVKKSLNTSRMQADKVTAGPTGLLKGCTTTGVVLELHGDSLVPLWSYLGRDSCPRVPWPCPRPLPRPLPRPACSDLLDHLRFGAGAPSGSSSLSSLLLYIYTGTCILCVAYACWSSACILLWRCLHVMVMAVLFICNISYCIRPWPFVCSHVHTFSFIYTYLHLCLQELCGQDISFIYTCLHLCLQELCGQDINDWSNFTKLVVSLLPSLSLSHSHIHMRTYRYLPVYTHTHAHLVILSVCMYVCMYACM